MFCPNCRNQIIDGADFCPHCGTNLKQIQNQNIQNKQPIQTQNNIQQPTTTNNKKRNHIVPIIIIVLVIGGLIVYNYTKNRNLNNQTETQQVEKNPTDNNTTIDNNIKEIDFDDNPTYDKNGTFLMTIQDTFTITGRGTVVSGTVERGTISIGDEVQILGLNQKIIDTKVIGIEKYAKEVDYAEAGDKIAIIIDNVSRDEIEKGQVIAEPNSITSSTTFDAYVYILTKEEGGRVSPLYRGYRPQFYFRNTDITGVVTFDEGIDEVYPGERSNIKIELITDVAMEVGTKFLIREGGHTVGKGIVTKVY